MELISFKSDDNNHFIMKILVIVIYVFNIDSDLVRVFQYSESQSDCAVICEEIII